MTFLQLQGGGGGLVEGTAKLGKQILGLEKRVLDPVQVRIFGSTTKSL